MSTDNHATFAEAIRAAGMMPPDVIEHGRFHRFPGAGKDKGTAGWCKLFDDGRGGILGDFTTGVFDTWQAGGTQAQSTEARAEFRRRVKESKAEARAKRKAEQDHAAQEAWQIWADADPAPHDHAYLKRKGVRPYRVRVYRGHLTLGGLRCDGALLVPLHNSAGTLRSLQFIAAEPSRAGNDKRYLAQGEHIGCYHTIGKPDDAICIAEGYATGASVHEATGHAVAIAFDAGNLKSVASVLRAKYPNARIIVCVDDDYRTEGNPGFTKGIEAARAVDGFVAIPDFGDDRPEGATDFNDLACHHGADAVKRAVANAKPPNASSAHKGIANSTPVDLVELPVVHLIRADTITPEPIDWIWDGWLAAGKFHVLAGQPGTGKTTLAMAFAATITSSGRWPDCARAQAANVLIWSGEDDPGDTLVPRLRAMGAEMSRIYFISDVRDGFDARSFDPARDVSALVRKAETIGDIGLLIVDPIVSAVSGDSHKNAETRRSLQPLVDLASKLDCAVLGITHLSKGTSGREPIERVTGSLAFGALARVVLVAAKLQGQADNEASGRMLVRAKSNIGPDTGGFGYDLEHTELTDFAGVSASRVLWGAAIDGTARELLAQAEAEDDDDIGGSEPSQRFLEGILIAGPLLASQVFSDADAHGFSKRQMQRARTSLGVKIKKLSMKGGWQWSLPKIPLSTEDASLTNVEPSTSSWPFKAPLAPIGANVEDF